MGRFCLKYKEAKPGKRNWRLIAAGKRSRMWVSEPLGMGDESRVTQAIEHGCNSEKPVFGVEKWLEPPTDERIITEMTGKTQFEP